jgi:hypothetical protein
MKPRARRIHQALYERLLALGEWDAGFAGPMAIAASTAGAYLDLVDQAARYPSDPAIAARRAETHQVARQYLADFGAIDSTRVHVAALDGDGRDIEIARLAASYRT